MGDFELLPLEGGLLVIESSISLREHQSGKLSYCKKFHHLLILPVNLLFVCSKNKWRSPTAETIYRHDSRVNVRSAGTNSSARKKITEQDLIWADLILVMEYQHKKAIAKQHRNLDLPEIIVLDIPDDYQYISDELIEMIQSSTESVLSSIEN